MAAVFSNLAAAINNIRIYFASMHTESLGSHEMCGDTPLSYLLYVPGDVMQLLVGAILSFDIPSGSLFTDFRCDTGHCAQVLWSIAGNLIDCENRLRLCLAVPIVMLP